MRCHDLVADVPGEVERHRRRAARHDVGSQRLGRGVHVLELFGRAFADACVVHEHVEASVGVRDLLEHRPHRGGVGDVGLDRQGGCAAGSTDRVDGLLGRFATEIVDDDGRTLGGEAATRSPARSRTLRP